VSCAPEDFDYPLPPERIAQVPLPDRAASRLLVLDRATGEITHATFRDLPRHVRPHDALVINDTRVLPARLPLRRATGGRAEALLLHPLADGDGRWTALVRPAARLRPGEVLAVAGAPPDAGVGVRLVRHLGGGEAEVALVGLPPADLLRRYGQVPLPPYIRVPLADGERYQTVYAAREGSAAAPTAGLHFTEEVLEAVERAGARIVRVTLHVGLGTFLPPRPDDLAAGRLHAEWFEVSPAAATEINAARRVVAVGTTAVRTLESAARGAAPGQRVAAASGWTDLLIVPGHRFAAVDAMVTNFHLPRSTLLMLVSAFAGRERVLAAYRTAVAEGYRFFSFGDAMLIQ
jgi:S-adenosylmethionine:tRNA ribosyltransferase-isomerase